MTTAQVVTRGYGSFGTIGHIVTRGYGTGSGPDTAFGLASIMRARDVSLSGTNTDAATSYSGTAADTFGLASRMRDRDVSYSGTIADGVISLRGSIEDP